MTMPGRPRVSMPRRILLALALLAGVAATHGKDLVEASALYDRGAMLKAAELGRGIGTADGFALAAQATLVAAVYQVHGTPDRRAGRRNRAC